MSSEVYLLVPSCLFWKKDGRETALKLCVCVWRRVLRSIHVREGCFFTPTGAHHSSHEMHFLLRLFLLVVSESLQEGATDLAAAQRKKREIPWTNRCSVGKDGLAL